MAHQEKDKSLVSVRCSCGFLFYNEFLKGKRDDELEYERDAAFARHVQELEGMGYL